MKRFKRVFLLVLDSLGVGAAPDAKDYKSEGSNTLGHIMEKYNLYVPNLMKLGFLNTLSLNDNKDVDAYYTVARPTNFGKDSLSGHYEIIGSSVISYNHDYENGFPIDFLREVAQTNKCNIICNRMGSVNNIIDEYGERQIDTNSIIVFTESDATLEILYYVGSKESSAVNAIAESICKIAKKNKIEINRVVVRSFEKKDEKFILTNERKDFVINSNHDNMLTSLKGKDLQVISIGKINELFNGEGITKIISANSNIDSINKLIDIMDKRFEGLCYVNLNDFDTYGHNHDLEGYARAIEVFDINTPMILNKLDPDDLLIITADHGNDPTFDSCLHTRENVPVIIYSRQFRQNSKLNVLDSLADIGATVAENFEVETSIGKSFLGLLK